MSTRCSPTNAAVLNVDGSASLIRITPDLDTVSAVLGAPAYGLGQVDSQVMFCAVMPRLVFITSRRGPWGDGARNLLAEQVYRHVSDQEQQFKGQVVGVGGDLDTAVRQHAMNVRDLRNPQLGGDENPWDDYTQHTYCEYAGGDCICDDHEDRRTPSGECPTCMEEV